MLIGIDLGGTKTEIIAIHSKNGKEVYRKRVPSPRDDYQASVKNIANLVKECDQTLSCEGSVGIGIPGTVCPTTKLVKNSNSAWLNGKPLDLDLAHALNRPVRIMNDANCFALSEAIDGAGKGFDVVFGVIIGTGTGAGIVINQKPINGANSIAGEWGLNRMVLETPEELASRPAREACGRLGLVESYLSGPGLKAYFHKKYQRDLSTHDIMKAAEDGDADAEAALKYYEHNLAKALAFVINILDPNVIILGGGMGNLQRLYTNVPKIWNETDYISSDTVLTKLVPPRHGDSSGVRGAAWLWRDDLQNSVKFAQAAA